MAWQRLEDAGIPFLGLRDNPWGFDDNFQPMDRTECVVATDDEAACGVDRNLVYAPVDPAAEVLATCENMIAVDTDDTCSAVIGTVYVYRDSSHVSEAYTLTLERVLAANLEAAFDELGISLSGPSSQP